MKKDLLKRSLEVLDSYNAQEFVSGMDLIYDLKNELRRAYTDEELTEIYKKANGESEGKAFPITTQKIFAAMRAMKEA